jgi:hypothetical protein
MYHGNLKFKIKNPFGHMHSKAHGWGFTHHIMHTKRTYAVSLIGATRYLSGSADPT